MSSGVKSMPGDVNNVSMLDDVLSKLHKLGLLQAAEKVRNRFPPFQTQRTRARACTHTYTHTHTHTHIHTHTHTHMYAHTHMHAHACTR